MFQEGLEPSLEKLEHSKAASKWVSHKEIEEEKSAQKGRRRSKDCVS